MSAPTSPPPMPVARLLGPAFLTFLLICSGAPALASPAAGVWRSPEDQAQIEIYDCGSSLCGRILTSSQLAAEPGLKDIKNHDPALRERPLKGLQIIEGFSGGPTHWKGGAIYRPTDGRAYSATVEVVDAATLKVTGCLMMGLCESETWVRLR